MNRSRVWSFHLATAALLFSCGLGVCQSSSNPARNAPSPSTNTPSQPANDTAQQNPFPQAQSEAAAKAEQQDQNAPPPKHDFPGYSSSNSNLAPPDVGEAGGSHADAPNRPEKMDTFTRDQTLDGRIEDDLNVADLYLKNGNYRGAILRYQDAIQHDPGDETASFGIAYATCKQGHTAEALTLLKSYSRDHPRGKYAGKAEKLLDHPEKCGRK